ncbi:MAG: dockerin type I domain-containing protein, partial [Thermodesulfobacteriota bacterium]|nr:dockerin type I domain-containing protein [Thermodesulfobacteriota bacterium]
VDVSDPRDPTIIGSVDTPGTASGVAVIGEKAYVADGLWGLQVIDVSDPRDPTIIGFVDTPGTASGVAVIGEKAYVADHDKGLAVCSLAASGDKKGDVNGDNTVDLTDAILALQGLAGLESAPPVTVAKNADVNGDGRIGLEEALYVIHKVAGVRP